MRTTDRDEKTHKQDNTPVKEAICDTVVEWIGSLAGIPFLAPLTNLINYIGGQVKSRVALTCNTRVELYERGREILEGAKKEVTSISTIPGEETPLQGDPDPRIQNYFIALHRLAYRNFLLGIDGGKNVRFVRYIDLKQADKCQEAFSLLYHGKDVEIWNSQMPVEFLTADERCVLIGFPSDTDGMLLGGVRLYGKKNCKVMVNWVQSHGSDATGVRVPGELAKQQGQHNDGSCLCNIVKVIGDASPLESRGEKFDAISSWYRQLYEGSDSEKRRDCYRSLAKAIGASKSQPRTFLDIGCGPAFGADELSKNSVRYYGLDASEKMIMEARKAAIEDVYHCDAIGALMKIDPRASKFYREAPKKFDVIACQGNTFDFFLGPVQKALALYLFNQYLADDGMLLFTGHSFSKNTNGIVTRTLPGGGDIRYELSWHGEYVTIKVLDGKGNVATELIQHPCSKPWLVDFLENLHYEEKNLSLKWFGPNGEPDDYEMWTFNRRARP
jgi:SAM-dependent methyltransferase